MWYASGTPLNSWTACIRRSDSKSARRRLDHATMPQNCVSILLPFLEGHWYHPPYIFNVLTSNTIFSVNSSVDAWLGYGHIFHFRLPCPCSKQTVENMLVFGKHAAIGSLFFCWSLAGRAEIISRGWTNRTHPTFLCHDEKKNDQTLETKAAIRTTR